VLNPAIFEQWAEAILAINQYVAAKSESAAVERKPFPKAVYTASPHQVKRIAYARGLVNILLTNEYFARTGKLDGMASAALEFAMEIQAGELPEFSIAINNELSHSNSPYRVRMYLRTGQSVLHGNTNHTYTTEIHDVRTARLVAELKSSADAVAA
jgi:hypothetical protein